MLPVQRKQASVASPYMRGNLDDAERRAESSAADELRVSHNQNQFFAANDCAKIEWLERFDMRAMTRRAIPRARLVAVGTPRNETRQRNRMAMNSSNIVSA